MASSLDGVAVVRRATVNDAAQLARLYNHAFGPTTPAQVKRWIKKHAPTEEIIVAEVEGTIVSAVSIEPLEFVIEGVRICTRGIAGVATTWEHRRRGYSTMLMKEAMRRTSAQGVSNASLFTGRQLPAIRIYHRLGFTEESNWIGFVRHDDPVGALIAHFSFRSKWLPKTPPGKEALARWRERVLIKTPEWSATVTCDGKRFRVLKGRRGRPTLIMRGRPLVVFECFFNRLAYDRSTRSGALSVTGSREARQTWRRIVTLEWRE